MLHLKRHHRRPHGPLSLGGLPVAAPAAEPVTPDYKGFPSIYHWVTAKHGGEVKGLMEAHGISGEPQPIQLAELTRNNPGFKEELLELIDLLKSANGYDGREQFDGFDSFDEWRDHYDNFKRNKVDPFAKGLAGNDSSKKRRSASDIMDIIGKGISVVGSAANAGADVAAKIKGMNPGGSSSGGGDSSVTGGSDSSGFMAKYKWYIVGGVVIVIAGVAALFLIKKKK